MSFYGSKGQPGGLPAGQRASGQSEVNLTPQLFNFTQSQLQFQAGHNLTFPDPNNQIQMQNIQLAGGGAPQLLLQQQQPNFPNLNVNFLTEQIGVGQILQPSPNQSQSINLITPMSVALSEMRFAQPTGIQTQPPTTSQQQPQQAKQRVFTGTVTKTHDDFGFIDEDVFFHMSVVKGPILPKPGDRVLVEADYNPSMPFHWNATRVQIVNMGGGISNVNLNPGGGSSQVSSPQPITHASQANQSVLQAAQHTSSASAATLLNMNQYQATTKSNQQQNQQNAMSQSGVQQSQANRYPSNSNAVSIVSNSPYGGAGRNTNLSRPEENSRVIAHSRVAMTRPPPPCITTPSSMVSLPSMVVDAHNMQHLQLPLPLQMPLQIPSLRSLNRDGAKERERDARERERERDARERERERDVRERERDREKDRREKRAIEDKKDRERERERQPVRSRERSSSKRGKEDGIKRDSDKEKEKSDTSSSRSTRNRSPNRDSRKRSRSKDKSRESLDQNSDRIKSSRSPSPKRPAVLSRPSPRYGWELPKVSLDETQVNVSELKRRYKNLYIPSDFFLARNSWQESFPLHDPLDLTHSCPVHIFRRYPEKVDLEDFVCSTGNSTNLDDLNSNISVNPTDENDSLKVKIILLSMPNKANLYRKACGLAEETSDANLQHLNRLINFVVGTKVSKNETMIVGGNWSPSLDGANPDSPQVLINTAIRTCKAQTGLDLRRCTKWYRFMELYYRRSSGNLETVVILLPNLWAALPNRKEWEEIQKAYKEALVVDKEKTDHRSSNKANSEESTPNHANSGTTPSQQLTDSGETKDKASCDNPNINSLVKMEAILEAEIEDGELKEEMDIDKVPDEFDIYGDLPPTPPLIAVKQEVVEVEKHDDEAVNRNMEEEKDKDKELDGQVEGTSVPKVSVDSLESEGGTPVVEVTEQDSTAIENLEKDTTVEECDEENTLREEKKGTHFSLLDPKHMTVPKLKEELSLRGLSAKGLKPQLLTRLLKSLKAEETAEKLAQEKGKPSNDEKVEPMEISEPLQTAQTDSTNVELTACVNSDVKKDLVQPQENEQQKIIEEISTTNSNESSIQRFVSDSHLKGVVGGEKAKEECDNAAHPSKMAEEERDLKVNDGFKSLPIPSTNRNKKLGLIVQVPVFMSADNEKCDNEKTRKIWERRYALPKTAHLLLHPSKESKKGAVFDCNQHSLNTLRDYRVADNKEQSFEVSLCAELFHEMLQRDFAFRIYRELVYQAKISSITSKNDDVKKDDDAREDRVVNGLSTKEENQPKKRKLSSSSTVTGPTKVTKTIDPHLLLAFVFFDHTRCGYITDVDLEDLCLSVNLGLTRAQIRKLVQKVVVKGVLHYRKWTDSTVDENTSSTDCFVSRDDNSEESLKQLSQGNKPLLPTFGRSLCGISESIEFQEMNLQPESDDTLKKETELLLAACDANADGVDVKRMRDQLEKSEKDRAALDANLKLYKNSLSEAKVQIGELKLSHDVIKEELNRVKEMLKKSEAMELSNQADLQVFRQASQRFVERVKDYLIKSPVKDLKCVKEKEIVKKDKLDENSTNE